MGCLWYSDNVGGTKRLRAFLLSSTSFVPLSLENIDHGKMDPVLFIDWLAGC
jgi:hypothetical protein